MQKIPKEVENDLPQWVVEHVPEELVGSTLFRFIVKLRVRDDSGQPKEILVDILPDLDLDLENLVEQMQDLPSQYAFWAAVYSELKAAVAGAERKLKVRRSRATKDIQDQQNKLGVKLPVETIKTIVEGDKELIDLDLKLLNAQLQAGKLLHMLEALKMKSELARSLAGFKRQEMQNS